ncbi:probable BOI-related E3 ubiquitin-protein ligase 3 [Ipomoea triloba]|uniref:probable BOI-related E3 ubiquitin-protein ligase 3 n=1 Tax=Ipomoea triloba TaxID=35885 RepID=UPI00125DA8AF|nr:probable BOI-related E3 ubiquitin-protein ligase 3 [Ipomoea triloba]
MAVEATHLNLFSAQQLIPNRGFVSSAKGNGFGFGYNAQIGSGVPYGSVAMPESFLPVNRSLFCEAVQGKTSINTDSGVSYNLAMDGSRKRSREEQFIGSGEDVTPLLQQYQSEIYRIVSNHTKKLRMELEERQKQEARILVAAIGEDVMKKVREKDEQIQTLGKLNFALQERVKSLYLENQLWRDLAQTNEATANSLRSNLEQVLAHVADDRLLAGAAAAAPAEDAESCCDSNEIAAAQPERSTAGADPEQNSGSRKCRSCGERESSVLLLPCRHLCLCTVCGSTLHRTCPVCNSNMNATVHVNMSS